MNRLSQTKLSNIIKEKRKEKSLTQEQLSKMTDINRAMIGRIEKKTYIPSVEQLEKLADVLDFDVRDLFIVEEPQVFTAFRGKNLTAQEEDGINHLLEMMLAAKQQILLRKAFENAK